MGIICSTVILVYCTLLLIIKRESLERIRPFRWATLWFGPSLYLAVACVTEFWHGENWTLAVVLALLGIGLGLWRVNSADLSVGATGKLVQHSNWIGLLPIMVLVSFWPVEWVSSHWLAVSSPQIISKALALALMASSLTFAIIQTTRALQLTRVGARGTFPSTQ